MSDPDVADAMDLLPELLADSPRLRNLLEDRFASLMDAVFDRLEDTLDDGTPSDQQAVLKMLLPLMVRVKRENEVAGEDVEEARREMQDMFREMGTGLGELEDADDTEVEGVTI